MKVVPLGINGYLPMGGRQTSCFLVLTESASFLLDAGTGAARLAEPEIQGMIAGRGDLHVLLSHYHVDHTVGLYYAFTQWRSGALVIHAPVCPFIACNPEEAIGRLFSPPLNSYCLEDTRIRIDPVNGAEKVVAGHRLRFWSQQHPGGSVGIRIDDALAYVTDAVVKMEDVERVRGVDVLLHELWMNEADAAKDEKERNRHACFGPVAEFVKASRPGRVMPVHLYPFYSDAELDGLAVRLGEVSGVEVILPREGEVIAVNKMVEAGGIEPPSASVSRQPLRA